MQHEPQLSCTYVCIIIICWLIANTMLCTVLRLAREMQKRLRNPQVKEGGNFTTLQQPHGIDT